MLKRNVETKKLTVFFKTKKKSYGRPPLKKCLHKKIAIRTLKTSK